MNQISTVDKEKIIDEDAKRFYSLISKVINQKLNPSVDTIFLKRPTWISANVRNTLLCKINENHFVALKKSVPLPKMRRAVIISKIKYHLGFATYGVLQIENFQLRTKKSSQKNCKLLVGWENEQILMIDFKNYKHSKKLLNLKKNEIKNLQSFCINYGELAAFNYLFGVGDRNSSNFVFFLDSQILHSIDNEAWPFHPKGNDLSAFMIIDRTSYNIQLLIKGPKRCEYLDYLRKGFLKSWKTISEHSDCTNILNNKEKLLFEKRFQQNPTELALEIFNDSSERAVRWWKKGLDWWDTEEGKKFLNDRKIRIQEKST